MRGSVLKLKMGVVLVYIPLRAANPTLSPEQPRQITTQPVEQKPIAVTELPKQPIIPPVGVGEKPIAPIGPIAQQQVGPAQPAPAPQTAPVAPSIPPVIDAKPETPLAPPAQPTSQPPAVKPPEAPSAKAQPPLPVEEEKPASIDTVDLNEAGGNWLYKRIWWEKAESEYEKIQKIVQQIFELRMNFFNKRTELDRTVFDPFYLQAGLGRGELEELLKYLSGEVEAQRKRQGMLDETERAFLAIMTKEQEALDQLKLDIEGISKLDNAIDDTLLKLIEQLNSIRRYEQQAWDNFKEISRVLNDKKARELYYGMVNFEDNIVAIHGYIRKDLTPYFDQLIKTARDNIDRIKTTLQSLKEKGIDFKKKAQELESKENTSEREKIRAERERLEREQEEAEEQAKSWFGWMKGILLSIWNTIAGAFGGLYASVKGLFVSSGTQDEDTGASAKIQPAASE